MKSSICKTLVLIAVGLTAACASNASQKGKAPATNTEAPDELKKDTSNEPKNKKTDKPSEESYVCTDGASLKFTEGSLEIDGNTLSLFTGRDKKKKTLCEVLEETGKKSAIFQFAGYDCTTCMDEAVELKEFVGSSKGKDVAHILVFTDKFKDVTDEKFQKFVDNYASHATIMYDESLLWKFWSKDPSEPNRATIMAMNLNAQGHVLNEGGEFPNIEEIEKIAAELAAKL